MIWLINFILFRNGKAIVFVQDNSFYIDFLTVFSKGIGKWDRQVIESRHRVVRQAQRGVCD